MKVLFAVHDEKVSSSIVKKYQKEYKEIISYKNVYYFNAILKELQRDKTYNAIVIDEELEEFTSTSYEQKDRFIFDKLDNITDEATSANGSDIPIILICSERRTKSEEIFVKLFGIGIYNAIIGSDRSTDEVCRLIRKPRSKKEAKIYYKIDSEEVTYKHESENDVTEEEMQNIISYFKRIGKNTTKCVDGFKKIVSQYNDSQLKLIIPLLPLSSRAILEENSPEYQKFVSSKGGKSVAEKMKKTAAKEGTSQKLLGVQNDGMPRRSRPVVVPAQLEKTLIKKVSTKQPSVMVEPDFEDDDFEEDIIEEAPKAPAKRRGRPPKKKPEEEKVVEMPAMQKRGRGRPPKKAKPQEIEEIEEDEDDFIEEPDMLSEVDDIQETQTLPGISDYEEDEDEYQEDYDDEDYETDYDDEYEDETPNTSATTLPGIDDEEDYDDSDYQDEYEEDEPEYDNNYNSRGASSFSNNRANNLNQMSNIQNNTQNYDDTNYNALLTGDKKVVAFVGTSKNGTTFLVNTIAKILADSGINTAILDATKNQNSYYIYTNNQDDLREIASESVINLANGNASGIKIQNNLTAYMEMPNTDESNLDAVIPILETLVKNHSAVLIDCDFSTPIDYFDKAQEIYLVQSMDILTIQPLTVFLRELENAGVLNEYKLKVILNKVVRARGFSPEQVVEGMSIYKNADLSIWKQLFNPSLIKKYEVPFNEEVYVRYLEQIAKCEIYINKYPKDIQMLLKNLANVIYPLLPPAKEKSKPQKGYQYSTGFSNSVNNTLNNMKKRY